jgi:hypothetical protein
VDRKFPSRPNSVASSWHSKRTGSLRLLRQTKTDHPPSLSSWITEATPTETSILTSIGSYRPERRLIDAEGVLEIPPIPNTSSPVFECAFWFLSCAYISHDHSEWRQHCLSHFRGEEPPIFVQCPLCDDFEYHGTDGWTAWDHRQSHLASHHLRSQSLSTSRPDFHLFQHLWQKRLIDDQDWKELKGENYEPIPVENYVSRRAPGFHSHDSRAARRAPRPDRSQYHQVASHSLAQGANGSATANTEGLQHKVDDVATAPHTSSEIVDEGIEFRKRPQDADVDEQEDAKSIDWNCRPHREEEPMQKSRTVNFSILNETHTDLAQSLAAVHSTKNMVAVASTITNSNNGQPYHQDIVSSSSMALSTRSPGAVPDERSDLLSVIDCSEVESEPGSDSLLFESQSFECSEDSNSVQSMGGLSMEVGSLKEIYVQILVQSFGSTTRPSNAGDGPSNRNDADHRQTKGKGKHRAPSPPDHNTGQLRPSKRPNRRKNAHSNGDDDSDEENGADVPQDYMSIALEDQRLFACPFVKRYPGRYFKCYGHNLDKVSRVKFHLFRDKAHRLPIYCPVCSTTFDEEDIRDEHIRATACQRKPPIQWEGITSGQRQQLSKRSQSTISPEDNWYAIFRLLFPNHPLPHSPYIDLSLTGELGMFREHMYTQGPRIWNSILASRLPEELRSHLATLQSMSERFFPEAVERLCQTWTSQISSTDSLASEPKPLTRITPQVEPGTERFHAILFGEDENPVLQFDDLSSNVIDGLMDHFPIPALQTPGANRSKPNEPEWVEPTWDNDMSLYAPELNQMDQPQGIFWNVANMNMDNNPAVSVGMEELYDVLPPDQDESHSLNRVDFDSVNRAIT